MIIYNAFYLLLIKYEFAGDCDAKGDQNRKSND